MIRHLQNRWKADGTKLVYYGMRNAPHTTHNILRLSKRQAEVLGRLPKELDPAETKILASLVHDGIVVFEPQLKPLVGSYREARFCVSCVANDFMIPGLEFDALGQCPICQNAAVLPKIKSVLPLIETVKKNPNGRFDVALFYTGGKDSSYLLHHLANDLKLHVLALTWEIPYMSDSARASIENAKKLVPTAEFVIRKVNDVDLRKMYDKLYGLSGNTCACPSLAYVMFYPELVELGVPYLVLGNEPVQMKNLWFQHIAPLSAYDERAHRALSVAINILRVLTLRKPLRRGQAETLFAMRALAYGEPKLKRWSGYVNPLQDDAMTSMRMIPGLLKPFRRAIRRSAWTGRIPAMVHIDMDDAAEGYDWAKVKTLMTERIGWVGPASLEKGLHTSCKIEKCKEYTQFIRFREMKSTVIPFSAVELAIASREGNVTREEAKREMEHHLGFSLSRVPECAIMEAYLAPLGSTEGKGR
ncbi:MAG: hypothetical protein Q8N15_02050 [Bacillota bacterium]|nr:hypothetical protein [Bacillota bacterium]